MTEALHYRTFEPELEVLTRAKGGDGRTLVGIAVPWEHPVRITDGLTEQFARGAFRHQERDAHRVRVGREHVARGGTLIGRATELRDDAKGLYAELRIARTEAGDETLALVEDGALTDLSVAFRERQNRRLPNGVVERVTAHLREVAVVMEGAYGAGARVLAVRSANERPNLARARQIVLRPLPAA